MKRMWITGRSVLFLLLATLLAGLCIQLGCWQWHKGQIKQTYIQQFNQRNQHPAYTLSQWMHRRQKTDKKAQWRYTRITMQGHFDTQHFFLIDNRFLQHKLGYFLLIPFQPEDAHTAFLVNVGWIARRQGQALKKVTSIVSDKSQTVLGLLYLPPPKPFLLDARWTHQGKGGVLAQAVQLSAFRQVLPYPISDWLVLWDTANDPTMRREWAPVFSVSPQRHRAYALQWFSFACIALCGALILILKKR